VRVDTFDDCLRCALAQLLCCPDCPALLLRCSCRRRWYAVAAAEGCGRRYMLALLTTQSTWPLPCLLYHLAPLASAAIPCLRRLASVSLPPVAQSALRRPPSSQMHRALSPQPPSPPPVIPFFAFIPVTRSSASRAQNPTYCPLLADRASPHAARVRALVSRRRPYMCYHGAVWHQWRRAWHPARLARGTGRSRHARRHPHFRRRRHPHLCRRRLGLLPLSPPPPLPSP
jgi:hypothetical protein